MRLITVVIAGAIACAGCGGSGGGSTPTTPSASGTTQDTTVTISILGNKGAVSFSPNPATCARGQMVVWKNTDTITHRVVIDGIVDTRDIAPGASSAPMALGDVSKGYHCALHPGMVGALNGAETPDPTRTCNEYGGCAP